MTQHFTLSEMIFSQTAIDRKISNQPTEQHKKNLLQLCQLLETLRKLYGKPIKISSGYRSSALNAVIPGSSTTSSHCYGLAADIKPTDGDMKTLQKAVIKWAKTVKFDQIIFEHIGKDGLSNWLHIGLRHGRTGAQRGQLLYTIDGKKYYTATASSKCMTI